MDRRSRLGWWSLSRWQPRIISHGTLLTFGDNPVDFDVFNKNDLVRIRFQFHTDTGGVRAEYTTAAGTPGDHGDPPTVLMRFFNLVGGGTFSDGPVRVATVGGIALWVVYEVTTVVGSRPVKRSITRSGMSPAGG